ncbi:hypothetical protein BpHYR1_046437 [Brachionus plicatilis]|uniref:Uncharacterized protein n=1 Tax=Brachionus plicatilis TaxID=10195 RepID=A0A3M7RYE4_BRAPC|nr:hypothetical protein BpHYR1_046437 [Brachionus plicatilis]
MFEVNFLTELINSNNIDEIVKFLKDNDLIQNKAPLCKKCTKEMKWDIKTTLSDKYYWRCTTCGESKSCRNNSFFSQFDLPLAKILKIIFHWSLQVCQNDIKTLVGVSPVTINRIFQKLRIMCLKDFNKSNVTLGGHGEIVEIDESLFVRVKHHKGKDLKRKQYNKTLVNEGSFTCNGLLEKNVDMSLPVGDIDDFDFAYDKVKSVFESNDCDSIQCWVKSLSEINEKDFQKAITEIISLILSGSIINYRFQSDLSTAQREIIHQLCTDRNLTHVTSDLANENVVQNAHVMQVINSNKCVEEKRKRGRPPKVKN